MDDRIATSREVREQLERVVGGVWFVIGRWRSRESRARRGRKNSVITIVSPAVEGGAVVIGVVRPVAQIPPEQRIEFGLQNVANAVGEI